jgi:TrmH family RNA methyltransferase
MLSEPTPAILSNACVVLVRTQGPVNIGMIARLCGNLGITDLRLVQPECEVNCAESRKFSTHARDFLLAAPIYPRLRDAVADCGLVIGTSARERDVDHGDALLPHEVPALLAKRPAAKYALVFGNEADGLNDDEMHCCQAFVRLKTFGTIQSYNLSHAVGLFLYSMANADPVARDIAMPTASSRDEVEHLYHYWLHSLERFDYFRRTEQERFEPQLRRLFNRLHLSHHDVQMLWGMLAQFHYFTFGNRSEEEIAEPQRGEIR